MGEEAQGREVGEKFGLGVFKAAIVQVLDEEAGWEALTELRALSTPVGPAGGFSGPPGLPLPYPVTKSRLLAPLQIRTLRLREV